MLVGRQIPCQITPGPGKDPEMAFNGSVWPERGGRPKSASRSPRTTPGLISTSPAPGEPGTNITLAMLAVYLAATSAHEAGRGSAAGAVKGHDQQPELLVAAHTTAPTAANRRGRTCSQQALGVVSTCDVDERRPSASSGPRSPQLLNYDDPGRDSSVT
jgi:hypothetical protein